MPAWYVSQCLFKTLFLDVESFCLQDSIRDVSEKYNKAMISNAQLDNEKQALAYQVDCLKDRYVRLPRLLKNEICNAFVNLLENNAVFQPKG